MRPPCTFACRVFRSEKTDAEEGFQVIFNQGLLRFFDIGGGPSDFADLVSIKFEDFDIAHNDVS